MLHSSIRENSLFKKLTPMESMNYLLTKGKIGEHILRPSRFGGNYFVLEILSAPGMVDKVLLFAPETDKGNISIKYSNYNKPISLKMNLSEFLQNLQRNLQNTSNAHPSI